MTDLTNLAINELEWTIPKATKEKRDRRLKSNFNLKTALDIDYSGILSDETKEILIKGGNIRYQHSGGDLKAGSGKSWNIIGLDEYKQKFGINFNPETDVVFSGIDLKNSIEQGLKDGSLYKKSILDDEKHKYFNIGSGTIEQYEIRIADTLRKRQICIDYCSNTITNRTCNYILESWDYAYIYKDKYELHEKELLELELSPEVYLQKLINAFWYKKQALNHVPEQIVISLSEKSLGELKSDITHMFYDILRINRVLVIDPTDFSFCGISIMPPPSVLNICLYEKQKENYLAKVISGTSNEIGKDIRECGKVLADDKEFLSACNKDLREVRALELFPDITSRDQLRKIISVAKDINTKRFGKKKSIE